jgi:hypothetical protein
MTLRGLASLLGFASIFGTMVPPAGRADQPARMAAQCATSRTLLVLAVLMLIAHAGADSLLFRADDDASATGLRTMCRLKSGDADHICQITGATCTCSRRAVLAL